MRVPQSSLTLAGPSNARIVTIFIRTGGLHYTFDKLAAELYLLPTIKASIRRLMRSINIGFLDCFPMSDLFDANEALLRMDPRYPWGIKTKTEEKFRNLVKEL